MMTSVRRQLYAAVCTHHAGGEDEDEWRAGGGVLDDGVHVEHGRLDELAAAVVDDELRHAEADAVLTQRAHHQHALQLVARVVPFACR